MSEELKPALTENGGRISERSCCSMNQEWCHLGYAFAVIFLLCCSYLPPAAISAMRQQTPLSGTARSGYRTLTPLIAACIGASNQKETQTSVLDIPRSGALNSIAENDRYPLSAKCGCSATPGRSFLAPHMSHRRPGRRRRRSASRSDRHGRDGERGEPGRKSGFCVCRTIRRPISGFSDNALIKRALSPSS
jgi:hypothetical protein